MNIWKVYLITNQVNGKGYIGITSKSLELRMSKHLRDAYPGRKNPNGTLYALHAAFQKYGPESFSIGELEVGLSLAQARSKERHYIEKLGTYGGGRGKRGYNQTLGGEMPDEAYGDYQTPSTIPNPIKSTQAAQQAYISQPRVPRETNNSSQTGYTIGLILAGVLFIYFLSQ
jgi:group I intron endonuclease